MDIKKAIATLVEQKNLTRDEMKAVMHEVMTGVATPAQIGGFLIALRMKGETIDEVSGAVEVMRELATPVEIDTTNLVDTCGTGGDGAQLFNVSTASAFVVAAAGGKVAKHGNRSITSSTGSADVLEAAGVNLNISPHQVARAVESIGVGFMFAQTHHSAMKNAVGPRKELGLRTIFNMLGPMTNPAGAKRQVIGVFDKKLCRPMAEVLANLDSEHVMVVHSEDGLDEISIAATTYVAEMKDGEISEYEIYPRSYGIDYADLTGLAVESAEESLALIEDALGKRATENGKKASALIAINAGAAIYCAGLTSSMSDGVKMAEDAIATGMAREKLKQLAEFSQV